MVFRSAPITIRTTPRSSTVKHPYLLECDEINIKELDMAYAIKEQIKWLDRKGTDALASELVRDFADGTANDKLAEILAEFREGTRKERGRTVYIRNLLGAMKALCPELVEAVMGDRTESTPSASRFR